MAYDFFVVIKYIQRAIWHGEDRFRDTGQKVGAKVPQRPLMLMLKYGYNRYIDLLNRTGSKIFRVKALLLPWVDKTNLQIRIRSTPSNKCIV